MIYRHSKDPDCTHQVIREVQWDADDYHYICDACGLVTDNPPPDDHKFWEAKNEKKS